MPREYGRRDFRSDILKSPATRYLFAFGVIGLSFLLAFAVHDRLKLAIAESCLWLWFVIFIMLSKQPK